MGDLENKDIIVNDNESNELKHTEATEYGDQFVMNEVADELEESKKAENAKAEPFKIADKYKPDDRKLWACIEACLFSVGEAVEADRLAKAMEVKESVIDKAVKLMMEQYDVEDRGIRIIALDGKYQLCTKYEYYDVLIRLVNVPKKHVLTDVLLETLSIIAYKQPVTRQEIEQIRGVSCSHAINKLIEYNFVQEVGRLDAVGRPILFGTTDDFLRSFGVSSMDDLPVVTKDKIEDFKKQALEEIKVEVDT